MTFSNAPTCSPQATRPRPLPQSSTPCTHTPRVYLNDLHSERDSPYCKRMEHSRLRHDSHRRHEPSISAQCLKIQSHAHCAEPSQPSHLTLTCRLMERHSTTLFITCPACLSRKAAQASCQLLALSTYPSRITMACANNALHCDSSEQMNRR